jgi:hypothetical protein
MEQVPQDKPQTTQAYALHTSQEWDALETAAADGRLGQHYRNDVQALTRTHHRPNAPFRVQLEPTPEDREAGIGMDALERIMRAQDADCIFALLYVSRLLAPPAPLPANAYAGGWMDLDDVIKKIGWTPRNSPHREELRARVYDYLRFGACARVVGERTTRYINRDTGEAIDTRLDAPLWAFLAREKPVQPSLLNACEVPLRQEIVMSREWVKLIVNPRTVQYLPLGELLGSIPGDQPSGAWARCIGLALVSLWRREPQAVLSGKLLLTRRELLDHFTPKKNPPMEVLASDNPQRARKYWHDAQELLAETEILSRQGEAAHPTHTKQQSRKGWQEGWLDERVSLQPGLRMLPAVRAAAESRFPERPRNLSLPKRRGGRPRKGAS